MDKKTMTGENTTHPPLSEDELAGVSGGAYNQDTTVKMECWFSPAAGWRKDDNGQVWKKCNSSCHNIFDSDNRSCKCDGEHQCVDRWHKIEYRADKENGEYLHPYDKYNHSSKHPPNFNA